MNDQQLTNWLREYKTFSSTGYSSPKIMGVLNTTPDSFSDGGYFFDPEKAFLQAIKMIADGADIIDIGGESSRPGALPISASEEIDRTIPVIERLRQESDICISIDTTKALVMQEAVKVGASLINDISALDEEATLFAAAALDVPVCLMHMKGTPETMQQHPFYEKDIVQDINDFFKARIQRCLQAGITKEQLILDPGFGFGKTIEHNLQLTANIDCFMAHGLPVILGASRKSTLGTILNKPVNERVIGGIAIAIFASLQGVSIIRTHDVDETKQALTIIEAISTSKNRIKEEVTG